MVKKRIVARDSMNFKKDIRHPSPIVDGRNPAALPLRLPQGYRIPTTLGQIIATSHDLTPNGGLVREFPSFQENPGW